ncbi:MAG: sigma 54-interacting transcriptional regulator [Desulfovibrio sp.]|nr:sigma 54-interacting transcriptional regulator [Desulfovibrio sp.]
MYRSVTVATQTRDFSELREIIQKSLARSAAYGVDPNVGGAPESTRLSPEALHKRIRAQRRFYDLARGQMLSLYRLLRGTGFCMALADAEGYVLHVIGDAGLLRHFKTRRCIPGYRWTERDMGTCAIGLVLAERIPIFLPGELMYSVPARKLANAGAPILAPSGELLGAISLSGYTEKMHVHTLGLVRQAAETITAKFREAERLAELATKNQYLRALIDSDSRGIVTVDPRGCVVEINPAAQALLPLAREGRPLAECLEEVSDIGELLARGRSFVAREFQARRGGPTLLASLDPIRVAGSVTGGLFTVQAKKEVLRLAVRMTGSAPQFTFASIVGQSPAIREALRMARIAAANEAPVLLQGETGTGKELFAQAIHNAGPRRGGPFVAINCGAIPRELLESELFGYAPGAFTGAQKGGRPGKFELADNGTLFLDEIGDLPFEMQVKLLRALQFGEIQRLGSTTLLRVRLRVIAATSVDMAQAMAENRFRPDLFYRVSTLRIRVPPLRERSSDIVELASHFIRGHEERLGLAARPLLPETKHALMTYSWPGNIRQLENAVERAVYLAEDGPLLPGHFGIEDPAFGGAGRDEASLRPLSGALRGPSAGAEAMGAPVAPGGRRGAPGASHGTLSEVEREAIRSALARADGNLSRAARALGVSRPTLYRKLARHGLDRQGG